MKSDIATFLNGLAMGAANVIPGVSGGTIALITGIYERLINGIKRCDPKALKMVLTGKFKAAWEYVDGQFLAALMFGVAVSIVTLARLFEYLLEHHERLTMAFFFGLILLSIVYVAQRITEWKASVWVALGIGAVVAIGIAFLAPASENSGFIYVFICGIAAISSMILPGLSGSFVLIIMGNYSLVLGAINTFNLGILIPLALGCGFGLIAFSHILSWVFKHYANHTLAVMTGFVIGSLVVIWPWKQTLTENVIREGKPPKEVVTGYSWHMPDFANTETFVAVGLMVLGAISIVVMERVAGGAEKR